METYRAAYLAGSLYAALLCMACIGMDAEPWAIVALGLMSAAELFIGLKR